MSDTAKRSIYKGTLRLGSLDIPVSVYKGSDAFGLPGSLYHFECDGKVGYRLTCEEHPEDDAIITYTGIEVGGKIIQVNSQVRDELLERKCGFTVVSSHRLADLPALMSANSVVPCGFYEIAPNRDSLTARLTGRHDELFTLFRRLTVKRKFLLCAIGLDGCRRYAILLSGGQLFPLSYKEEIRDFTGVTGQLDSEFASSVDFELERLNQDFPSLSLESLSNKVTAWLTSHMPKKRARRNTKKTTAVKVPA